MSHASVEEPGGWTPSMRLEEGEAAEHVIRLLVIEDRPSDEEALLRQIRQANIQDHILFVNSGLKALDLLAHEGESGIPSSLTAIFLNLDLRGDYGLPILRLIKSRAQLAHIPVIVMTDAPRFADNSQTEGLPVRHWLDKPLDFHSFFPAVARALALGPDSSRQPLPLRVAPA